MNYTGKFAVLPGAPHIIHDNKTGLEFAVYNTSILTRGEQPDITLASVVCEYLNKVDILGTLLIDCLECLDSSGHSPSTVAEVNKQLENLRKPEP